MSRSGYIYDYDGDGPPPEFYRKAVDRAISGKRGQKFLSELAAEMDAMEVKELIAGDLVTSDGECCAMGVICKARNISVGIDETDPEYVAQLLGIATSMAKEIAYENDDDFNYSKKETPSQRWQRMRKWVADHLGEKKP